MFTPDELVDDVTNLKVFDHPHYKKKKKNTNQL